MGLSVPAANLNNIPSKRALLISLLATQEKTQQQSKIKETNAFEWDDCLCSELSLHPTLPMILK